MRVACIVLPLNFYEDSPAGPAVANYVVRDYPVR